jgi:hypothetical protein
VAGFLKPYKRMLGNAAPMRWAWLAVLLLVPTFSGCAEPGPTAGPQQPEPCLVERADDFSCLEAELNGTAETREHLHDYWGRQERVVLTDVAQDISPFLCTGDEPYPIVDLTPADGEAIYQGTAKVEVTLTFDDFEPYEPTGETYLMIKTAADVFARSYGVIASGETFVLDSTNAMNDLPHQQLSAWTFGLGMVSTNPTGCYHFDTTVSAHVEIVKGLDILPFPGHPDRWNGSTELTLLDVEAGIGFSSLDGGVCNLMDIGTRCLWEDHRAENGTVVPFDAKAVVVRITHTDGSPLRLGLRAHGADTRAYEVIPIDEEQGSARTWVMAAEGRGDGPYAQQSQWSFMPFGDAPMETYRGTYRIEILAQKDP